MARELILIGCVENGELPDPVVPALLEQTLILRQTETTVVNLLVRYRSGQLFDLVTGSPTIVLIIQDRCLNPLKTYTFTAAPEEGVGRASFTIASADLRNYCFGRYNYYVKSTTSGGDVTILIPLSPLLLTPV